MADRTGSRIGVQMVISGAVRCENQVIVEGTISGTFSGKRLIVGQKAHVEGHVTSDVIECSGHITGDIFAASFILKKTGCHVGTVETAELTVEPGAVLDCALQSGTSKPSQVKTRAKKNDVLKSTPKHVQALFSSIQDGGRPCCMGIPHSRRQKLYESVLQLLEKGKPLIRITGEKGSGKSTLVDKLKTDFPGEIHTLVVADEVGSIATMLERVGSDLGIEGSTALQKGKLLEKIRVILAEKKAQGRRIVLLVDNAQDLYPASMEGIIKHLTSACEGEEDMMQMILLGTSDMNGKMVATTLEYFEDETNCQLDLQPLSLKEVGDYLQFFSHQAVGGTSAVSADLFPFETVRKIHAISCGNMAEVNRLTVRAVLSAAEAGANSVAPDFL